MNQNTALMPLTDNICRWCGKAANLTKAHIIPRTFFEKIKGSENYSVLVQTDGPTSGQKLASFRQAGLYDTGILCPACDNQLSDLDAYGFEILGEPRLDKPRRHLEPDGEIWSYQIDCETDKLRRCLLSVLWRASISTQGFYNYINLEKKYENIILDYLKSRNLRIPFDRFETLVWRFNPINSIGNFKDLLFPPMKGKDPNGINFQTLYLPGVQAWITTDQRHLDLKIAQYAIRNENSFLLLNYPDHTSTREFRFLKEMHAEVQRSQQHMRDNPGWQRLSR